MAKKTWLFIIYLIVALYLFNIAFGFVAIPEFFLKLNKWILGVAGVLIIIESFRYLKETYSA